MTKNNFSVCLVIVIICVFLYIMNKDNYDNFEGYDDTFSVSNSLNSIVDNKVQPNGQNNVIDRIATNLVNNTNTVSNLNTIPNIKNETVSLQNMPLDVFKDENTASNGIPAPLSQNNGNGAALTDGFDGLNMYSELNEMINNGTILTSDNLLPQDKDENEFNAYKLAVAYNDSNLAANGLEKFGVDTIGSSKRVASLDLRGNVPCPKFKVSPWGNSSYDPDYNIKGMYN